LETFNLDCRQLAGAALRKAGRADIARKDIGISVRRSP
jgi:hypothetical protein